ncbi:MAG: ATP-binding protein [Butyricicoccus sp.]|nr:ATP-binding protein [Butyricicoccus sp.]
MRLLFEGRVKMSAPDILGIFNYGLVLLHGIFLSAAVSDREGHGYGCRSIHSIVEKNLGLCVFEPEKGIFTLHIALPAGEGASGITV